MKKILLLFLFCSTLSFVYAQAPDPQIRNEVVICTSTSDKTSLIKAESLKAAWKDSYIHTLVISPKANLKAYMRLNKLLTEAPMLYTPDNTLVICSDKNKELVQEAATGYNVLILPAFGSPDSMIMEGTMVPLTKKDNEPNYDFKFTEEKSL